MARFKGYEPDPAGLREFGNSATLGALCMERARAVATSANAIDPPGDYQAMPRSLPGGWANESRQGAVVEEGNPGAADRSLRALQRAVNAAEG